MSKILLIFKKTRLSLGRTDMCGIFGHSNLKKFNEEKSLDALHQLTHRGPDGFGFETINDIFLGHRRLSILDLSENGKQPMTKNGVYLTVNGEIYNFQTLRKELEKKHNITFKSHSDSEVLLHGYMQWGLNDLLDKIDGMFAFAIVDEKENKIHLARDHAGIKPLYYSFIDGNLAWSSELKSIESLYKNSQQTLEVNAEAVYDFLTYTYIPAPKSYYKNVYKLEPGHSLTFNCKDKTISKRQYWSLDNHLKEIEINEEDALKAIRKTLSAKVQEQLISDVPVGTFLSGGVDSSTVSFEASKVLKELNTFCQGNKDPKADESHYAQTVSNTIGSNHHIRFFDQNIANEKYTNLITWFDEPFAQPSAFPTYEVCVDAAKSLKVVLTGDGGDELFGGYPRFLKAKKVFKKKQSFPTLLKIVHFLKALNISQKLTQKLEKFEKKHLLVDPMERYMVMSEGFMKSNNFKRKWRKMHNIPESYDDFWFLRQFDRPNLTPSKRLQFIDFNTYMCEAVLNKVDRTSMAVSIETRVPFLSKDMISLAFSLPEHLLYKNGELKSLLKKAYENDIPKEVLYRGKKGFNAGKTTKEDKLHTAENNLPVHILKTLFNTNI